MVLLQAVMTPTGIDFWSLTSIIASLVSLIMGGFAIWLSVTFYKLSGKVAEDTKEASKNLNASVQRLESLFGSLYSDTFGMMKDTVSDMRKHIWPQGYSEEDISRKIEDKTSERILNIKKELNDELSEMIKRIGATEEKVDSFKDMSGIIEKAITKTRIVENEAQREILNGEVLNDVLHSIIDDLPLRMGDIMARRSLRRKYHRNQILNCIKRFIEDDIIEVEGNVESFDAIIKSKLDQSDFNRRDAIDSVKSRNQNYN